MGLSKYYDGTKLLSLKDRAGETPAIYLCVGNRTAGKTVFFKRLLVNNWIKHRKKFIVLYRFRYEVASASEVFFADIHPLFFPNGEMTSESIANGMFYEFFYDGESCGFAVPLSAADNLKKYSSYFTDVENVFLDEFQSETSHYAPKEIEKFQSIIFSVSRGHGKQFRYVRILMASNAVTLLNPYYKAFGIHKLLRHDTKFIRGDGWVLEQTFNESASTAIKESAFAKAISGSYIEYATQNVYLNDNKAFIEVNKDRYVPYISITFNGEQFCIKRQPNRLYVDEGHLKNTPLMTFNATDHLENARMVEKNELFMRPILQAFKEGAVRFKNQSCKEMFFNILSIK